MMNFLKAEDYYLKNDSMFKGISLLFLFASILLPVWIGTEVGFDISSPAQPLTTVTNLSPFLYFIIPVYACFFSTEGFEYGSVKNIIASGQSRSSYIIGKYLSVIKIILWWVFLFFGLFYVFSMLAAFITGAYIGNDNIRGNYITAFTALGFNILYLAAYAALVMMVGILARNTASSVVITFFIIFGDFLLSGYFKDSSSTFFRIVSDNTLMTQILKFSGMYVANSQHIVLSSINDYIRVTVIPIIIVAICLMVTLISFEKRDIHT